MELRRLAHATFKETTTSRYRGVSWAESKGQWLVQITTEGDKRTLGYFDDARHIHTAHASGSFARMAVANASRSSRFRSTMLRTMVRSTAM